MAKKWAMTAIAMAIKTASVILIITDRRCVVPDTEVDQNRHQGAARNEPRFQPVVTRGKRDGFAPGTAGFVGVKRLPQFDPLQNAADVPQFPERNEHRRRSRFGRQNKSRREEVKKQRVRHPQREDRVENDQQPARAAAQAGDNHH